MPALRQKQIMTPEPESLPESQAEAPQGEDSASPPCSAPFKLRLTPAEKRELNRICKASGLPPDEFARQVVAEAMAAGRPDSPLNTFTDSFKVKFFLRKRPLSEFRGPFLVETGEKARGLLVQRDGTYCGRKFHTLEWYIGRVIDEQNAKDMP